jgi:hypothetical protein
MARGALDGEATPRDADRDRFPAPPAGPPLGVRAVAHSRGRFAARAARPPARPQEQTPRHDSTSSGLSTVGHQVVGPEGPLGLVEALRFEHGSEVPFLFVVRDDERLTLVPARRVAQILPESRRLLLSPASSGLGRR